MAMSTLQYRASEGKAWTAIDSAMDFMNGFETLPSLSPPGSLATLPTTACVSKQELTAAGKTTPRNNNSPADLCPPRKIALHTSSQELATSLCPPLTISPRERGNQDQESEGGACSSSTTDTALGSPVDGRPAAAVVLPQVTILRDLGPDYENYEYIYKIIIIGNPSVGKTNLLTRFTKDQFLPDSRSTIGVDFASCFLQIGDNRRVKAQIWDSAGMELHRNITSVFYRSAVGVMVVYDVTDEDSFSNLRRWHTELDTLCNPDSVRMLIGNKIDLETDRMVSTICGSNHAAEKDMLFVETSALTCQNVSSAFLHLISHCDVKLATSGLKPGKEYLSFDGLSSGGGIHLPGTLGRGLSTASNRNGPSSTCCSRP